MPAKLTTAEFIERARAVHGERYEYSQVEYKYALEKIVILCPQHGRFEQAPSKHLSGQGCPVCGNEKIGTALKSTTAEFIRKAHGVHGNKYDYSQVVYDGNKNPVSISCPEHGSFSKVASDHLSGQGCPVCGNHATGGKLRKTLQSFLAEAHGVHGNKYDYSQVVYETSKSKVNIICPQHGRFEQAAGDHTQGKGCAKCARMTGQGWSRSAWTAVQKGRKATLYIIFVESAVESFYKIGITFKPLSGRFPKCSIPYQFRTVALYKSYNAGKVYDLEKQLHRELKQYQHQPLLPFGGQTECFTDVAPALAALPPDTFFLKWAKEHLTWPLNAAA